MKKEIKDYLHLYLGANYIIKYKYKTHYTRKALPRLTNGSYYNVVSLLRSPQYYDVKLILRRLCDMTEEDHDFLDDSKPHKITIEEFKEFIVSCPFFNPDEFKYLLSKGFDLFGLIEAGLAIDRATLK